MNDDRYCRRRRMTNPMIGAALYDPVRLEEFCLRLGFSFI